MTGAEWFRCFTPLPEAEVQLVCFPHAGGSASAYFPLARTLSPEVEVRAVQYPGRQERRFEPLIGDITELADRIHAVLDRRPVRRLAFFGHSMGAVVAFEVARRIERHGGPPLDALFVSGRRAPSHRRPETISLRGDDEASVLAELLSLSGTDARILQDAELRELILPVVRGDYAAIEGYDYIPGPPLNCPVTVLTGDADPLTTVDEARDWANHTRGGSELTVFPGGHFFLDAHRPAVARLVEKRLAVG
ncbi:alpha/beta fold hydrolase [Actinocorallia sp. API 0066]|uniref:thioesterase II family protein n=1 Tax=Actinocorallia sp. API 0066 TaxID=2896846 RepID=UPI001E5B937F|nr:alpha/beta fold hydrolase [Actinocorallia sp. API 0066]MCD0451732.1 alpha/beta fold hydrolase [Actinocorallia sp. API 0066]